MAPPGGVSAVLAPSVSSFRIGSSPIHGRGLFATRDFSTGEIAAIYVGECIAKPESARRQADGTQVFIFELNEEEDLDGNVADNPARFANHSCEPNCEAVAVGRVIHLRALHPIAPGGELTFDYGFPLAAFPGHPCRCGAASCPGFIVAQSERRRVRGMFNRPARQLARGGKVIIQEANA